MHFVWLQDVEAEHILAWLTGLYRFPHTPHRPRVDRPAPLGLSEGIIVAYVLQTVSCRFRKLVEQVGFWRQVEFDADEEDPTNLDANLRKHLRQHPAEGVRFEGWRIGPGDVFGDHINLQPSTLSVLAETGNVRTLEIYNIDDALIMLDLEPLPLEGALASIAVWGRLTTLQAYGVDGDVLLSALAACPLTALTFGVSRGDLRVGMKVLASPGSRARSSLAKVQLEGCDQIAEAAFVGLASLPRLQCLCLDRVRLAPGDIHALSGSKSLRMLEIGPWNGPTEEARETLDTFRTLAFPDLKVLSLSYFLGNEYGNYYNLLIPCVACPGLVALNIRYTDVTDAGCLALMSACPRLRLLDIEECDCVTEEQRVAMERGGITLAEISPLFHYDDVEDVLHRTSYT